ncbi:MAG: hypothetical protein J6K16_05695 [Alphaproteobacteria bacterium]|nr:hypothetical protein [Alphaproteobacteria bacterium]
MSICKKVLGLAATLLVATSINSAKAAEEEAVLFKIHDITPVKSAEGEVVGCDFVTTFYNRSSYTVRNASMGLAWKDEAINGVIEKEKKEDEAKNRRGTSRGRSATERVTDPDVEVMIEIPTIKPATQIAVKSRANTDRCFLMIDNVKHSVKSCNLETPKGGKANVSNRGRGAEAGCNRIFQYVSAEDPQYYLEFKAVSVDAENAEREEANRKNKSQVDDMYRKAVSAIDTANSVVSGIK